MVKKMRMTGYEWTYTHKQKIPREGITHCILITLLSKSCEPKNGESSKNKVRKIGNGLIKMQTHYLHCNFFHYTKVGIRFSALIIRNQIFYICLSFTPVSMLYRPVWILCIILYRVFFKHFIIKENKVDLSKPTIFISNHNNAFIDPIVYAATILSRMYFIVRGDIFNTPVKRWFLWNLGQIPMFRIRDGIDNVKRNESSFEQSYDLLGNNENILIFPEADCVQKKRLRGLKKGTARMAFGAVTKHGWDIDLQILPVMNNYTYPREFRTEVMTNVGEPICLNDYREIYEKDENQALARSLSENGNNFNLTISLSTYFFFCMSHKSMKLLRWVAASSLGRPENGSFMTRFSKAVLISQDSASVRGAIGVLIKSLLLVLAKSHNLVLS